ncbi:acyl-CoA dehydrogenase domain-containing protein [Caldalkalibacillus thermarum TA2.A1]|uniref:Acyl-CoA dehydrogenase domain-containing protein n=1 Tax=Caldalkalibacillus thermarum (strain TA2.A1) TaxID=986075 RepID=F5L5Y0_CALTT|nr:acyl-CoA dehydrogenase domain-containing protein [Caldalkalibacillus thermarum TA2.A1]
MIDFSLTEEQKEFQKLARDFAKNEIRPVAHIYDESEEVPWEVIKKAAKLGLTAYRYPAEYGGLGIDDPITSLIITEELAWGCAGIATAINGTGLAATAIMIAGTEEQKKKYIPMFCDPDNPRLGAMGLTEPGAGSDVASMKTTAIRDGNEYVLNGTKQFITNGGIADVHVIFAQTEPGSGWDGIAAFVVEKGTLGLKMGKKEKKMGVRASHTAQVILEDCRIPVENRLGGEPGSPTAITGLAALKMLEATRPSVGAAALGIARAAYEYALEYARERKQFGKPIIKQQAIAFKLADMATEIEAARLLIWKAGWMVKNKLPFARGEGSMAKLFAGDVAVRTALEAIQILGGYGYIREYPVEKFLRDAKIYQIWEGTAEIQRLVISRLIEKNG